jgi:hypothetical protein
MKISNKEENVLTQVSLVTTPLFTYAYINL